VRAAVFHRHSFDVELPRPVRCPHLFDDARQCTYTAAMCPGHKGAK
jgi:hypothetical protein